ncbi:MAG: site-specific integrase [Trebonia sp.]
MGKRGNSEGSLYKSGEGWRGYVWCSRPDGTRYRKYVRGQTHEEARQNWVNLRDRASRGPVASDVPKLAEFLAYWLNEIVEPNLAPKTFDKYEMFSRLHIIPYLGGRRLDNLQVKDIRQWLNKLAVTCQCCAQGKDAARPEGKRRCCAIGKCCQEILSTRSRADARDTLRAALSCAVDDETVARNPVKSVKTTRRRTAKPRRKRQAWTVDDARWFLESAWHKAETLYAAFVLVLVLGLRRGEVLGLAWEHVDLDTAELYVGQQLQRVRGKLLLRGVKTEASEAPLPLPVLCVTALRIRKKQQDTDRARAGDTWVETGLVFTTKHGTPIDPQNFNRSFDRCITAARVPRITVHGTRKTCATLLAALDVHPRVAMHILRHSKIAVTMEIYTEAPSEATCEALRKLSEQLVA